MPNTFIACGRDFLIYSVRSLLNLPKYIPDAIPILSYGERSSTFVLVVSMSHIAIRVRLRPDVAKILGVSLIRRITFSV